MAFYEFRHIDGKERDIKGERERKREILRGRERERER